MNNEHFFDIETQYLIQDFEGSWNKEENYRKIKLAVAGVKYNNKCHFYEEDEIGILFNVLDCSDKIVGYNILNFDYRVVQFYLKENIVKRLKNKTFDMWQELYSITGDMIGLDDLAKTNIGVCKNENTREIPKMWRDGKHQKVKEYLTNDLKITEDVYNFGKKNGMLKYYGGEREVEVDW